MFRFTIRELVLLTLVVALALGWWLERQQTKGELRTAVNSLKRAANERAIYITAFNDLSDAVREQGYDILATAIAPLGKISLRDNNNERRVAVPHPRDLP